MTARDRDIAAVERVLADYDVPHADRLAELVVDAISVARKTNPMHRPAQSTQVGRSAEKRLGAIEWLTAYLAESPDGVLAGQVQRDAQKIGIHLRTLRRAADDLKVVRTSGGGAHVRWMLDDEHRKLLEDGT